MLTRISTGLAMAAAIIGISVFTPPWGLGLVVLGATFVVAGELMGVTRPDADAVERALFLAALLIAVLWPVVQPYAPGYSHIAALTAAFALLALGRIFRPDPIEESIRRLGIDALGLLYVGLTFPLIYLLRDRPHGGWVVILVMAITFGQDTGAFFAGKFLGRHKLYPKLSPKKTVEGAVGGVATGVAFAFIARAVCPGLESLTSVDCLVLGAGGAAAGMLGDLFESMLKRAYDVKDSGTLIPGHGGLLDRIDGLLFCGPFAFYYLEAFR